MNTADSSLIAQLTAEVVSIGDEMTSGARVDTNAAWLSRRLGELGVQVLFHSTVGDTLQHNIDVFRTASQRADIVVSTGGLGPTRDDLTREALAAVVDRPLEFRPDVMQYIESLFARMNREMPERNRVQAMFPEGSEQIFNKRGTAPGIDIAVERPGQRPCRIFALPGVPAEMTRMFDETLVARILELSDSPARIAHRVVKFFGIGESDMERRLGDMISRDREPRVGITASSATISLRITATASTDEECDRLIDQTRDEALRLVPEFHFGDGEQFEQFHAIDEALLQRGQKLVIVELGKAAPLCNWFSTLGEESCYRGGLSLETADDIVRMFPADTFDDSLGNVKEAFGADWLLMVDHYPQLYASGHSQRPSSKVYFVVVPPDGSMIATERTMASNPDILHTVIAKTAMACLRTELKDS